MAKQLSDEEILAYKEKDATAVQERFADWLIEKLQIEFSSPKNEAAFRETVRLATALRMVFQASPENQEARTETRAERQEAKASRSAATPPEESEETAAPAPAKTTKATAKKSAKATPAKADDGENGGDTAVAPAAKPSAPKKASARSGGKPAPF